MEANEMSGADEDEGGRRQLHLLNLPGSGFHCASLSAQETVMVLIVLVLVAEVKTRVLRGCELKRGTGERTKDRGVNEV